MQVKKEKIKDKIYNAAFEEFHSKNFKKATMSTISEKSGVPVGNIYRYYANKEAIFHDIVGDISLDLSELFENQLKQVPENEKRSLETFSTLIFNFIKEFLDLFFEKRKKMHLLLEKSQGSKYENFKTNLEKHFIEISTSKAKWKFGSENLSREDLELVKISSSNFLKGVSNIMTNYFEDESLTRSLVLRYTDFFISGISDRLKLSK